MSKRFLEINSNVINGSGFKVYNRLSDCSGSHLLSEIFVKYEVPEEYQKVFFYRNLLNDSIKEFFTDTSFHLLKTKKGNIKAICKQIDNKERLDFHIYRIDSNEINCSKDDIMDFYLVLYDNGYLKGYLSALNDYFCLNMDLNDIFKLSESNESLSKKKKLYKQKMLERND